MHIPMDKGRLLGQAAVIRPVDLPPLPIPRVSPRAPAGTMLLDLAGDGSPPGSTFHLAGDQRPAKRRSD